MKYITLSFIFYLLYVIPSSGQNNEVDTTIYLTFAELLDSAGMTFTAPQGYKEIKPVHNRQMNYEKAYKHPRKKMEIRYAIRLHQYQFFEQMFMVTVLNISGGQLPEHTSFNPDAAREEFGADGGATVFVSLGEEFGMGYKYCLFVYIYKAGVGDAYLFFMANDKDVILDNMMDGFYSLKYNK